MSEVREQQVERMQALLERWEKARRDLGPEEFAALHRDTMDELNSRVRDLHGIDRR
jgi:hypothetical protein